MPTPTLQRDLSRAGPCPYQRSTRVSRPGGNTPRTMDGRATKPYPAERPDPVHRGAHKVTGSEARDREGGSLIRDLRGVPAASRIALRFAVDTRACEGAPPRRSRGARRQRERVLHGCLLPIRSLRTCPPTIEAGPDTRHGIPWRSGRWAGITAPCREEHHPEPDTQFTGPLPVPAADPAG